MKGPLKELLDAMNQSEREIISTIGVAVVERRRVVKQADDERWRWIIRHSTETAVERQS